MNDDYVLTQPPLDLLSDKIEYVSYEWCNVHLFLDVHYKDGTSKEYFMTEHDDNISLLFKYKQNRKIKIVVEEYDTPSL